MAGDASREWAALREASHDGLRRDLVARLHDGTTDLAAGPMAIARAEYVDPARHAREREAFRRMPILASTLR